MGMCLGKYTSLDFDYSINWHDRSFITNYKWIDKTTKNRQSPSPFLSHDTKVLLCSKEL